GDVGLGVVEVFGELLKRPVPWVRLHGLRIGKARHAGAGAANDAKEIGAGEYAPPLVGRVTLHALLEGVLTVLRAGLWQQRDDLCGIKRCGGLPGRGGRGDLLDGYGPARLFRRVLPGEDVEHGPAAEDHEQSRKHGPDRLVDLESIHGTAVPPLAGAGSHPLTDRRQL